MTAPSNVKILVVARTPDGLYDVELEGGTTLEHRSFATVARLIADVLATEHIQALKRKNQEIESLKRHIAGSSAPPLNLENLLETAKRGWERMTEAERREMLRNQTEGWARSEAQKGFCEGERD